MYKSFGEWTKIDRSVDTHSSKGAAVGVANALINLYGYRGDEAPCSTRGICTKSWVEDKYGNIVYENDPQELMNFRKRAIARSLGI